MKRVYSVDTMDEIARIKSLPCMARTTVIDGKEERSDFPLFFRYTRDVPVTKNGKELPYEDIKTGRQKVTNRINEDLVCPMNYLESWLDKIQGASKTKDIPNEKFLRKIPANRRNSDSKKVGEIRKMIETYAYYLYDHRELFSTSEGFEKVVEKTDELTNAIRGMKINLATTHRLIQIAFGININDDSRDVTVKSNKIGRKILIILYHSNPKAFLSCFVKGEC